MLFTQKFLHSPISCVISGRTALMLAAYNGHTEIVKVLLNYKVDIDSQDSVGCTALTFAANAFRFATIKLLCNKGANKRKIMNKHALWSLMSFEEI